MRRFPLIQNDTTYELAKNLLVKTEAQLGRTPNLYRAMANSPAALEGYLNFREALTRGKLSVQMREHIALYVAGESNCHYCISAHAFRGKKVGIDPIELQMNLNAESSNSKTKAALQFIGEVMKTKGQLQDTKVQNLLDAGWSNEEMGEMVAHVALNIFSNYFNHLAKPELDFPESGLKHE